MRWLTWFSYIIICNSCMIIHNKCVLFILIIVYLCILDYTSPPADPRTQIEPLLSVGGGSRAVRLLVVGLCGRKRWTRSGTFELPNETAAPGRCCRPVPPWPWRSNARRSGRARYSSRQRWVPQEGEGGRDCWFESRWQLDARRFEVQPTKTSEHAVPLPLHSCSYLFFTLI